MIVMPAGLERGTMERRTFDGRARWARWHPDSQRIAYSTYSDEGWSIRSIIADRRGASTVLVRSQHRLSPESFSPDGRGLVYQEQHPETGEDLWLVPADGAGPSQPLLVREAHDSGAEISPDGQWLAHHSNVDGAWHVYVTPFPGPGTATKVSAREGGWPQWKPDGTELLYISSVGKAIFAMSVSNTGDFGQPRQLFETGGGYKRQRQGAVFRFAPDGESIVVALWEWQPASLQVAVNWLDELLASFEDAGG